MKWFNKLSNEQLINEMERQKIYLKTYLENKDRIKTRDYIKYMFQVINTCKVILKSRNINI